MITCKITITDSGKIVLTPEAKKFFSDAEVEDITDNFEVKKVSTLWDPAKNSYRPYLVELR